MSRIRRKVRKIRASVGFVRTESAKGEVLLGYAVLTGKTIEVGKKSRGSGQSIYRKLVRLGKGAYRYRRGHAHLCSHQTRATGSPLIVVPA
jgi:hypothetical protein